MVRTVHIEDLPSATRDFLARLAPNEEVIIEDAGHPVARITSVQTSPSKPSSPAKRSLGLFKGQVWLSPI